MAAIQGFDSFFEAVFEAVHNFSTADVKIALTNTEPTAGTDTQLSDITQITAGGGYVAGGYSLDNVTSTQTGGVYTLGADDEVITASGAAIATWQYAVIYNDSATNDELIGYLDNGSAVNLGDGESITVQWSPASTVLTHQETP